MPKSGSMLLTGGLIALGLLSGGSSASGQPWGPTQVLKGTCVDGSRIAEGPADVDLASYRSAYFCDSTVVSEPGPGRRLIQFAQKGSLRDTLVAFAVEKTDEPGVWNVTRIYFRSGVDTPVNDGMCIFNYEAGKLASIVCGGRAIVKTHAAAISVGFEVDDK